MEAWLHDWLSLLLRWAHFVTGVAWIGASFYFNWLENHLQRRAADSGDPIAGDLWAVHGGGFYYLQKYRLAPSRLPEPLHWFKYEAYFTWITGFALLCAVYYGNASLYLLDPAASSLGAGQAVTLGIGALLGSWLFYHVLCRGFATEHPLATAIVVYAWFSALAWVLGETLSARAAYIHVGAAIGTVMVANVFFVIIPAQKELVAALEEGRPPDPGPGREALERSRHNNYLTLPVLFIMISHHYPAAYGSPQAVAILMLLSLAGVGIRHYFNLRHLPGRGRWVLALSLLLLLGAALLTVPKQRHRGGGALPSTAVVLPTIQARCGSCHAQRPSFAGMAAPPLGVVLESGADIERQAERIRLLVVDTHTMPPGNLTGMTEPERGLLAAWHDGIMAGRPGAGAKKTTETDR